MDEIVLDEKSLDINFFDGKHNEKIGWTI